MKPLNPAKTVDSVLRKVALESLVGCPFSTIWKFAEEELQIELNDIYKRLIWNWLYKESEKIELINSNNDILTLKPNLMETFNNYKETELTIRCSKRYQWLVLTGGLDFRESEFIGPYHLQIMITAVKAKEKGTNAVEISKMTGQDNRCIGGRVSTLVDIGILKKVFIREKQFAIIIHKEYFDKWYYNYSKKNPNFLKKKLNLTSNKILTQSILECVNNGLNKQRIYAELYKEFNIQNHERKKFRGLISRLVAKGYLRKVFAKSQDSERRFLCVQLVEGMEYKEDDEDIDIDDDTNDIDVDIDDFEIENEELPLSEQSVSEKVTNFKIPTINNIVPYLNQAYFHVANSQDGLSSSELSDILFGSFIKNSTDLFASLIPDYVKKPVSHSIRKDLSPCFFYCDFNLAGGYQFNGKIKSFKFVILPKYVNQLKLKIIENEFDFYSDKFNNAVNFPLSKLTSLFSETSRRSYQVYINLDNNKKEYSRKDMIYELKGKFKQLEPFKKLEIVKGPRTSKKKLRDPSLPENRGRKKKGQIVEKKIVTSNQESVEDKKRKLSNELDGLVAKKSKADLGNLSTYIDVMRSNNSESVEVNKIRNIKTSETFSFTQNLRFQNIKLVLKESNGVSLINTKFAHKLSNKLTHLNIDKKTILRDVEALHAKNELDLHVKRWNNRDIHVISLKNQIITDEEFEKLKKESFGRTGYTLKNIPESERLVRLYSISLQESELKRKQRLEQKKLLNEEKIKEKKAKAERKKLEKITTKKERQVIIDNVLKTPSKRKYIIHKFTREESITLFRLVIITRSLKKDSQTDFNLILKYFKNLNVSIHQLSKRWSAIRTNTGIATVNSCILKWKNVFLDNVKNGIITMDLLKYPNLNFYLKLWKRYKIDSFDDSLDLGNDDGNIINEKSKNIEIIEKEVEKKVILFENNQKNKSIYSFNQQSLNKKIDYIFPKFISSIQRENFYLTKSFTFSQIEETSIDESFSKPIHQFIKSVISSDSNSYSNPDFQRLCVNRGFNNNAITIATELLENEKIITIFSLKPNQSQSPSIKFLLSEKIFNLPSMYLEDKIWDQGLEYFELLSNLQSTKKSILLPTLPNEGSIATIIDHFDNKEINLSRIQVFDKTQLLQHNLRTVPDDFFDSRFIITINDDTATKDEFFEIGLPSVPIPTSFPCSRIWIEVNGQINKAIFHKVVKLIIGNIFIKPAVTNEKLYKTLNKIVSYGEMLELLGWLINKNCIELVGNGYIVKSRWYTLFS